VHKPAGRYVCLYDGKGEIQFRVDATVKDRAPGRRSQGRDAVMTFAADCRRVEHATLICAQAPMSGGCSTRRRRRSVVTFQDAWEQAGGKLFAVFSSTGRYSKWGSWGVLEHHGQDPATAPKYKAMVQFMEKNPIWWK